MPRSYNSGTTAGPGAGALDGLSGLIMFPPFLLIAGVVILWSAAREDRRVRGLPYAAAWGWPFYRAGARRGGGTAEDHRYIPIGQ